jgi:methyl-accepting chemotaxis protein
MAKRTNFKVVARGVAGMRMEVAETARGVGRVLAEVAETARGVAGMTMEVTETQERAREGAGMLV